jgi:hypothetical protein
LFCGEDQPRIKAAAGQSISPSPLQQQRNNEASLQTPYFEERGTAAAAENDKI